MSTAQAAVEYRFMIRDFADILDPGNPNDLQNINTTPLPNGAICYVNAQRAAYVLDKFSDASANGASIFAPIAGPGRWVLLTASSGGAPAAMAYSTAGQNNTFTLDDAYHAPATAEFSLNEDQELERWSFTASGCVLTWNGPALPMLVLLSASVSLADGTPARDIHGFVSVNNEDGAAGQGGSQGIAIVNISTDGTQWSSLVSQRFVAAVSNGSTLRPKFAAPAGGTTGNIAALTLIALPL
jgi:hypothetical protein